ncbi:type II toxin-antitoxin system BrnA family antitoxin [Loktanella sp. DJP18]|uniref:type II toxin-antitoxin system BrnA family antitoxin n=1 Tax=Loktanella sp. DJP18 TaxID=3409788 RepID=UPI003BB4EB4F
MKRTAPASRRSTILKATEFDERFDAGEDISANVDWSKARRLNVEAKRVNVDFPTWVVSGLDRQAQKLGITRQALIKIWIAERLQ